MLGGLVEHRSKGRKLFIDGRAAHSRFPPRHVFFDPFRCVVHHRSIGAEEFQDSLEIKAVNTGPTLRAVVFNELDEISDELLNRPSLLRFDRLSQRDREVLGKFVHPGPSTSILS